MTMTKDWLIPVARNLIASLVAVLAAYLAKRFGIEVTDQNRDFLTSALTTIGVSILLATQLAVSKWMKGWFLRSLHEPQTKAQWLAYEEKQ
jgi:branched-subunit amino acid ABC-type transport system permease component